MSLHQDQKTLRWEFKKRKRYARNHANDQEQENSNFQEKSKKTTLLTKRKSSLRSHLFSFINSNRCCAYILQLSDLPVKAYLVFGSTGSGQDPLGRVPRSGPRPHDAWTGLTRILSINIFQIFIKLLYFIIETKLIYIHEFIRGNGGGGSLRLKSPLTSSFTSAAWTRIRRDLTIFFPLLFFFYICANWSHIQIKPHMRVYPILVYPNSSPNCARKGAAAKGTFVFKKTNECKIEIVKIDPKRPQRFIAVWACVLHTHTHTHTQAYTHTNTHFVEGSWNI